MAHCVLCSRLQPSTLAGPHGKAGAMSTLSHMQDTQWASYRATPGGESSSRSPDAGTMDSPAPCLSGPPTPMWAGGEESNGCRRWFRSVPWSCVLPCVQLPGSSRGPLGEPSQGLWDWDPGQRDPTSGQVRGTEGTPRLGTAGSSHGPLEVTSGNGGIGDRHPCRVSATDGAEGTAGHKADKPPVLFSCCDCGKVSNGEPHKHPFWPYETLPDHQSPSFPDPHRAPPSPSHVVRDLHSPAHRTSMG